MAFRHKRRLGRLALCPDIGEYDSDLFFAKSGTKPAAAFFNAAALRSFRTGLIFVLLVFFSFTVKVSHARRFLKLYTSRQRNGSKSEIPNAMYKLNKHCVTLARKPHKTWLRTYQLFILRVNLAVRAIFYARIYELFFR